MAEPSDEPFEARPRPRPFHRLSELAKSHHVSRTTICRVLAGIPETISGDQDLEFCTRPTCTAGSWMYIQLSPPSSGIGISEEVFIASRLLRA